MRVQNHGVDPRLRGARTLACGSTDRITTENEQDANMKRLP